MSRGLFVVLPALYLELALAYLAECFDEGRGEASVGDERYVVVDGSSADAVAIGELALAVILWYVDDEVELMVGYHLHDVLLVAVFFVGPCYGCGVDSVLIEELGCAFAGADGVALGDEGACGIAHCRLLLCAA